VFPVVGGCVVVVVASVVGVYGVGVDCVVGVAVVVFAVVGSVVLVVVVFVVDVAAGVAVVVAGVAFVDVGCVVVGYVVVVWQYSLDTTYASYSFRRVHRTLR